MSEDKLIDGAQLIIAGERSQSAERRFQENSHERFFFPFQASNR